MHRDSIIPDACARAHRQISSRLDSELSEFEQASLEAHLQHCVDCQAVAESFAAVTEVLRSAPVEAPSFTCWLPRVRGPRTYVRRGIGISVAAAMAIVALSGLVVGLQVSVSPTQGPDVRTRELMGLKERMLEQMAVVGRPEQPPRGVMTAENTTLDPAADGGTTSPRGRRDPRSLGRSA